MSYESIILELMKRVQDLEGKVKELEGTVKELKGGNYILDAEDMETDDSSNMPKEGNEITRAIARDYIINRLKEENPQFDVRKANREQGSGIVLAKGPSIKCKIKFMYSRSYVDNNSVLKNGERLPHSWHTLSREDIINRKFDAYIFTYVHEGKYHSFMFTQREIEDYVKLKTADSAGNYYFYFVVNQDEKIETREDVQDVFEYYDRFKIPCES
jgi:hypothetical protein